MLQTRCGPVCRAEQERHRSVSTADTPPKCSDLFDQRIGGFFAISAQPAGVGSSSATLALQTHAACELKVFLMFW